MMVPLVTGAVLGVSFAAPFGPVSLLCVQRSIAAGPGLGIITGLGASSVHVLYATLSVAGAGVIAAELVHWDQSVRFLSCAVLVLMGFRVLMRRPPAAQAMQPIRLRHAFASSFAVALCNPLTVTPYLLVASSAAAVQATDTTFTFWSVPGVFLGTATWYAALSGGAALFRSGLPPIGIRVLNQIAGAMLIGFGLLTIVR